MTTKHSPGPWASEAVPSSDFHFIRQITSDTSGQVAKIRVGPVLGQDEALANAKLIAAAPDLLAALEGMILGWESGRTYATTINNAKDAIAKAKGEAA